MSWSCGESAKRFLGLVNPAEYSPGINNNGRERRDYATFSWIPGFSLALAGCASKSPYPQLPQSQGKALNSTKYRIAAGDSVQIFVWRNPDVSTTVTVRPMDS